MGNDKDSCTGGTGTLREGCAGTVFIVGAGRSGTTLLRLILDAHSKVYSGSEDQLALVHLARWFRIDPSIERFVHEVFRFHTASGPLSEIWGLQGRSEELLERLTLGQRASGESKGLSLAAMFEALRSMVLESLDPEAVVWCIKTPHYALHPWVLAAVAPDAVVVHLVRDGRDVARSFLEGHLRGHIQPPTYARAAEYWRHCNAMARRAEQEFAGSYTRIRFEDLVQDPLRVITRLCGVLGIEVEEAMFEHEKGNRGLEKIAVQERAWHESTGKPIDASRVGRGAQAMSSADQAAFSVVAGSELRRYGYQPGARGGVVGGWMVTVSLWLARASEWPRGMRTAGRWGRRFVRFRWLGLRG